MKRVLAIIDLQEGYLERIDYRLRAKLMDYVYNLIQTQKFDLIVNVSYDDMIGTTTDKRLNKLLRATRNVIYMVKGGNDGSEEILTAIETKGFDFKKVNLEIVGVNSDACVFDTLRGLFNTFPSVDRYNTSVHYDGVATESGKACNEIVITSMQRQFAVKII